MARVTVEDCLEKVPNRFHLVSVAVKRAKMLLRGARPLVESDNKDIVTALREIAAGEIRLVKAERASKSEKRSKKKARSPRPAVVEPEDPALEPEVLTEPGLPATTSSSISIASTKASSSPATAAIETAASTGALVPQDPLSTYLAEIRRYPVLSREEEHELALRYFEHDDQDAAYRLITSNLRLVVIVAREYQRAFHNLLDLVQEGNVGLLEAVKQFDPYRGVRLPSYAVWWIRAYVIRYVMNNFRLVKVGTTQAQRRLFFNLKRRRRASRR